MIRLPKRWQVADALSGDEAFPGDVRQQTDESVVVPMHERNDERGESSEHRSAGEVRQAVESFAAALASRFEVGDRKESRLTCARWRRLQRSGVVGGVIRSASGVGTKWLADRPPSQRSLGLRATSCRHRLPNV